MSVPARDFRFPLLPAIVLAVVGLTALLVGPQGDFPLHDDWVHRHEVDVLFHEHRYEGAPILTSTLVAQALWGDLFAHVLGLSYEALRISTLVLAVVGLWAAVRCSLELGMTRTASLAVAGMLWFSPLFLPLAFTFMTDVPFACVLIIGALFALRSLRSMQWPDALAATGFFWLAFFIRQHGAVVLGAYLAALAVAALGGTRFPRRFWIAAAAGTAVGAVLAFAWMGRRAPNAEQVAWLSHAASLLTYAKLRESIRYGLMMIATIGLFSLAVPAMRMAQLARGDEHWPASRRLMTAVIFALGMLALVLTAGRLPLGHDVLHDLGTGWRTLTSDENPFKSPAPLRLGAGVWWGLTAIGMAAASIYVTDLVHAAPRLRAAHGDLAGNARSRQALFLFLWVALFMASLVPFLPRTADRYVIPALLPAYLLAMMTVVPPLRVSGWLPGLVPLAALALFATAGAQDYMAWNRARWHAIDDLRASVPALQIDGGLEYNGINTREEYRRKYGLPDDHRIGRRGFWVVDDVYAISFGPRKGFETRKTYPYFTLLGLTRRELLVLKRTGPVPPNPPREEGEDYDVKP